jgi:hypothetical protein
MVKTGDREAARKTMSWFVKVIIPNIFFTIWRVYPIESASVDIDHKDFEKGRAVNRAPYLFALMG